MGEYRDEYSRDAVVVVVVVVSGGEECRASRGTLRVFSANALAEFQRDYNQRLIVQFFFPNHRAV